MFIEKLPVEEREILFKSIGLIIEKNGVVSMKRWFKDGETYVIVFEDKKPAYEDVHYTHQLRLQDFEFKSEINKAGEADEAKTYYLSFMAKRFLKFAYSYISYHESKMLEELNETIADAKMKYQHDMKILQDQIKSSFRDDELVK